MKQLHNIVAPLILFCLMAAVSLPVLAQEQEGEAVSQQTQDEITPKEEQENTVDVKEIVFGHIGDSYEWHITTWGNTHITIPLPIIVYSSTTGWHTFLSSRLEENGGTYEGLSIAPEGSKYEGKLVEYNAAGEQVRPWDISITKVTFALLFNSVLLLIIVLSVSHWYRKRRNMPFVGVADMTEHNFFHIHRVLLFLFRSNLVLRLLYPLLNATLFMIIPCLTHIYHLFLFIILNVSSYK